ncbi:MULTISPECIES: SDR family NAD(P)-dependent oxidoreductase [unclassified Streptomyces]|uniref:SDR family NAD(P)-dependent oxidoreductase n=1 Tax=unclassified Streptomyces TaxID=2593676 RepID=UPI0033A26EBE
MPDTVRAQTCPRKALTTGHQVIATGRRPQQVDKTPGGPQDNLLATRLDVTSIEDTEAAAQTALDRFGRTDVLINNGLVALRRARGQEAADSSRARAGAALGTTAVVPALAVTVWAVWALNQATNRRRLRGPATGRLHLRRLADLARVEPGKLY